MATTKKASQNEGAAAGYSADDLQVLEGLEAVRKRPGMYIGSTDGRGLQHCMWEIIDNSVDEAIAGHCTRIEVILHADHSVEVVDNGRGIPIGVNAKSGLTGVELVFTKLHAGGKFGGSGYEVSGGLHGVGASVVNALSSRLDVVVDREGTSHTMSFERGDPGIFDDNGNFTPKSGLRLVPGAHPEGEGTRVRYWADRTIFLAEADIDLELTYDRARQTAFLVPGLEITVTDDRGDDDPVVESFRYDGGTRDFVEFIAPDLPICDPVVITGSAAFEETVPVLEDGQMVSRTVTRDLGVDIALRWGTGYEQEMRSFVNIIATPKGGTHVTGFERAVTKAIVDTATALKATKANEDAPTKEDVLEGLSAIVCVRLAEPQFEGQTKEILGTAAATKIVADIVTEGLREWAAAKATKTQAKKVADKVVTAARTRRALRLQKETIRRKNALESSSMPAKLADCRSDDLEKCEIIVVEGDSAMGCGSWFTLVSTVFGGPLTLKELAEDWQKGIVHFGYATDTDGAVVVVPLLEPRITHQAAAVVEVTLDNGEALVFTPDHLFRLRDGSYCRADALEEGMSLMPLYRRLSTKETGFAEGYEQVFNNATGKWDLTHRLADRYNLAHGLDSVDNGTTRHHADFNKRNNTPSNIVRMTPAAHFQLHGENVARLHELLWHSPEYADYRAMMSETARKTMHFLWSDPAFREDAKLRGVAAWEDPDYRAHHTAINQERTTRPEEVEKRVAGFLDWYNGLSDAERTEYADWLYGLQAEYWSDPANRAAQSERTRRYFEEHPEHRERHSQMAIEQWDDPELLAWRSAKTVEQFADPAERERQAQAVRDWAAAHPEAGAAHSELMKERMQPGTPAYLAVRAGRDAYLASTTKEDRAKKINDGKRAKALLLLKRVLGAEDVPSAYDMLRLAEAPTGFSYKRLRKDFASDEELFEAAALANHSVVSVRHLEDPIDVYDLTVEGYHNFALEAGIFVHNSSKAARDSEFQALLPIRGKILNTFRATEKQMLDNAECAAIITAMGAGSGKSFDIGAIRYGKFIIMTDADVDGSHIRTLLLTLCYRYMRPLLDAGRVYAAVPPLRGITLNGSKEKIYTYTDEDHDEKLAEIEQAGKTVKSVQRYKGLGEMDADQLAETTMDMKTRTLRRVTASDAAAADELFEILMGSNVGPRREFIVDNALTIDRDSLDV